MIISDLAINTSIFITSVIIVAVSSFSEVKKETVRPKPNLKSEIIEIKKPPKEQVDLYRVKLKCIKLEKDSEELLNNIKKDLK